MSTQKSRRRSRRIRLLLVAAFVAVKLAIPGASKADAVKWHVPLAAPTVTTDIPARTASQSPTSGAVALGGFTSQGWPVVLELGHGGKLVTAAAAGMDLTCASGLQFSAEDQWQLLDIAKNGKIQRTEQFPPAEAQGATVTGSHSLTGRFDRHRSTFRGVWRLQLNFAFADGTTDQCHSGPVRSIATL